MNNFTIKQAIASLRAEQAAIDKQISALKSTRLRIVAPRHKRRKPVVEPERLEA